MHGDDEWFVGGRGGQFGGEPGVLWSPHITAGGNVGIEADDRAMRGPQRPITVRLRHRVASVIPPRALDSRRHLRFMRTEIFHETIQGIGTAVVTRAVVVS